MIESPSTRPGAVLVTLAALVVVLAGLRAAQPMVVPFLLSVFIAVISAPALLWLEDRGLARAPALAVVVAGIIAVAVGLTAFVGGAIRDFTRNVPVYRARLDEQAGAALGWLREHGVALSRENVTALLDPGAAMQLAGDVFNGFGGVLTNAFLIFMTVVFILFETSSFPTKVRAITDDPEHSLSRFRAFTENLRRYLAIKTLTSFATGCAIAAWLAVVGVDFPVLWGFLAFLLNYVPNIGSIIAAVPAVLLALVQLGVGAAAWSAAGFVAVNVLVGTVLEPRFMGRGLGLSTLVVFLSLVFWGWVLGPVGMFLSVPLTMTAKIALDSRDDTRWLAVLLGTERGALEAAGGGLAAAPDTERTESERPA